MNLLAQLDTSAADAAAGTAAGAIVAGMLGFIIFMWVLGLVSFILWLWALIDVIRREFSNPNDKTMWIIIVLLVPLGAVVYLIVGRKKGTIPAATKTA